MRVNQDGKWVHATTGEPLEVGGVEKMSKSKKNVVDPDEIIARYGADTARWFMLSDTPPERDIEWTEAGAEGAWRFTQRIWRLVNDAAAHAGGSDAAASAGAAPRRPQGAAGGDRGSRVAALQPRHRAHLRAGQCAGRSLPRQGRGSRRFARRPSSSS